MDQNPPEIFRGSHNSISSETLRFSLNQAHKGAERVWRNSNVFDLPAVQRLSLHLAILCLVVSSVLLSQAYKHLKNPQNFQPPTVLAQVSEDQPPLKQITIEKPEEKISKFEEIIFKNFSAKEKVVAEAEIAKQIKTYLNQTGHEEKAKRVLDWEKNTIKPILDLDVLPQGHQFWSEFMSAIAYIESDGKTNAVSEAGIVGVAQISQATAESTAKRHWIEKFDLKKGWDSLRLSRFHFQDLMERYSPDIALLGYFAGGPFTDQKVLASLEIQVNVFNLGSEDGKEYFTKTVAAHRILQEAKKQLNFPQTTG